MRLLVPSFPHDVHAVEVALVLRELGHEVVLWNGADFPTRQCASVELGPSGVSFAVAGAELDFDDRPFDVVWQRRVIPPVLPERMHPGDRPVAERECQAFVAGLWQLVSPGAFWVNPPAARERASAKLVQLREARAAGLETPRTLSSNDPARIRAFLRELGGTGIYKAFTPAQWEDGDKLAVLLTSDVRADSLPPDEVLRLTPGIFQPRIEKSHELRVTVIGERVVTARLDSQAHEATRLDWRARSVDLAVAPDVLPGEVERAVRELMRRLGLVFGCLDLIVTPEGRHVFLEVNPMGQFLWLEHGHPDVRLLGPFCDLLLSRGRPDAAPVCASVRHADWFARAEAAIAATADAHVRWATPYVHPDAPPPPRSGRSGAETLTQGVTP
jgi:hypothetical protein